MRQMMLTDVMFIDHDDANEAMKFLAGRGFEVEVLESYDVFEGHGPTILVRVTELTEDDAGVFLHKMTALMKPFLGDVSEAGPADRIEKGREE